MSPSLIALVSLAALQAAPPGQLVNMAADQAVADQGPFVFVAASSQKALDVSGISLDDGAQVWQWAQNGQTNQQWMLRSVSGDVFTLINVNSQKVLDVRNGSTANGAGLQQWQGWGGDNQKFRFVAQSDGSYEIVGLASGRCVDVQNANTADGTAVTLWDCWGGANQRWFATAPPAPTPPSLPPPASDPKGPSLPLHTSGNKLLNSNGAVVQLRGVNIASLVWTDGGELAETVNPPPCYQGQTLIDTINAAFDQWHANHIRLALSPDRWWNVTGHGASYRALVDQIVALAASKGAYVNVDMHVSNAGQWGAPTTQHGLPDINTKTVLSDVAAHFANNPAVLFGIYNEPQMVSWPVWLNGGWVNDITGASFQGIGMQEMVDAVRATGAKNVVIVDGTGWASQLQGVMQGYAVRDDNLMYDAHVYPGVGTFTDWQNKVGLVSAKYPLYIGEFGGWQPGSSDNNPWPDSQTYLNTLLPWIRQNNFSYAAWTFGPDAPPVLLKDWCYTPTDYYGAQVKAFMAQ